MPTDPRKRQKKLERRQAKRKAKKDERGHEQHASIAERLAAAADWPILNSWATLDLWKQGIGSVCLSRQHPGGSVAFAVFLVDRYCLGVKDAMYEILSRAGYDSQIVRKTQTRFATKEISPAFARKIVEGAVAYAESLGLHPHPDYFKAQPIFGAIDASETSEELEFGKNGKPLFIAGPYDTPQRCQQIQNTLDRNLGPDGYHFIMPIHGASRLFTAEDDAPDEDETADSDTP